jgi:protein-tyrosine phosphatase
MAHERDYPMSTSPAYPVYWVTPQLATGPAPMSYDHLESLKSEGIDAIMNLCAEYCDLHSIESHKGFEVYYLPIQDEEAPKLKALEDALAWLDEAIYLGKKVYVHCRHGIGRTGTIISAYLLRRGLGSKLVNQKIKKMRSQPANFNQWWFLRKLGKKEGRLTIREPSLEWKSLVDLSPFFADYEKLSAKVDQRLEKQNTEHAFCGRDHMTCCTRYVEVSLIEAAYLTHTLNRKLSSKDRLAAIERSVEVSRKMRSQGKTFEEQQESNFSDRFGKKNICPLSLEERCLVYKSRPLACRFSDLEETDKNKTFLHSCHEKVEELSKGLFLALCGTFLERKKVFFPLLDVVSGKFVQTFFHLLSCEVDLTHSNQNSSESKRN